MSADDNPNSLQEMGPSPESPAETAEGPANPPEAHEVGSLLESMERLDAVPQGEVIQGKVLKVTDTEVIVDVGLKSEAAVPRAEFLTDDGQLKVSPGDAVDVCIDQYDESAGTLSVSHQQAVRRKVWEEIDRAFQEQKPLRGRVVDRIKGGLIVDIGVSAFLPGSHADSRPHSNLDALNGQEILCKVIKLNRKRNNVVVSRKLALEEERDRRKAELLERLVEGTELVGRVKNLTDYGVFVDLGAMDGLLHITDLSWGRVSHASEVVQAGQEIRVKVLKFDREKERVSLGLKQLTPDPWEQVPSDYRVGDRVTGRVVNVTDYGAFVELQPGVEGLIHISEMTWSKRLRHPSKIVHLGDRAEVAVLEVDAARRRISLSLKQSLPDPWANLGDKYAVGSVVSGPVRNLTSFGAFVELEEGVDGLIHLSNLSWEKNPKHPSEVLKKGEKVDAVVLSLDAANRRVSLGLKQLAPDTTQEFISKIQVGDVVRGMVTRTVSFGAFVELEKGIEGLCHVSEYGEEHDRGRPALPEVGSEHDFRVIRLDRAKRKISLSLRALAHPPAPPQATRELKSESITPMAEALSAAGVTPHQPLPRSLRAQSQREGEVREGDTRS